MQFLLFLTLLACLFSACGPKLVNDTSPPGIVVPSDTLFAAQIISKPEITWQHAYHKTLTMKLFLAQAPFEGEYKRRDAGESVVYLTFEQALEAIKKNGSLNSGYP